jgi:hypothetical protein
MSAKHSRRGPQRDRTGAPVTWHHTKPRPWDVRRRNRARNRRARRTRRINRNT